MDPLPDVKNLVILYSDAKREYFPTEQQYITEKDAEKDSRDIAKFLEKYGYDAHLMSADDNLVNKLARSKPDLVLNLVDSIRGQEHLSSIIPGIMDMMSIAYTGANVSGFSLCFNKFLTRYLFRYFNIPVPNFYLFDSPNDNIPDNIRYPVISKLNDIHGGVEISLESVSENSDQLRNRLGFLTSTYNTQVLVEEFIEGREVTIFLLGTDNPQVYMAEKILPNGGQKYHLATFDSQWMDAEPYTYEKFEDAKLKKFALKAFEAAKMSGYAKFDVRIDSAGNFYFIDSNANPALCAPGTPTALNSVVTNLYGIGFEKVMDIILKCGYSRKKMTIY